MTMLRASLLFVLLAAPAAADNSPLLTRVSFVAPNASETREQKGDRAYHVSWIMHSSLSIDLDVYGYLWTLSPYGSKDAHEALVELESRQGYDDFRIVAPLASVTFQGRPAWTMTRLWSVKRRAPGNSGKTWKKDWTMAIQRRWGYVVIQFSDDPVFFDEDKAQLDQFLQNFKLLPEPPISPMAAIGLLAAIITGSSAAGAAAWRRRRAARG